MISNLSIRTIEILWTIWDCELTQIIFQRKSI